MTFLTLENENNFNSSEMSIFSDKRVRERICVVLDSAGVAERDFEEWIRRPPNLTTVRVNSHRTPTSKLKERLEDYLDKVSEVDRI